MVGRSITLPASLSDTNCTYYPKPPGIIFTVSGFIAFEIISNAPEPMEPSIESPFLTDVINGSHVGAKLNGIGARKFYISNSCRDGFEPGGDYKTESARISNDFIVIETIDNRYCYQMPEYIYLEANMLEGIYDDSNKSWGVRVDDRATLIPAEDLAKGLTKGIERAIYFIIYHDSNKSKLLDKISN